MVGDIISEQRAELSRNGGRLHSGTVGGFGRNPHITGLMLQVPTYSSGKVTLAVATFP
jgi:hypothetical protein